MPQHLDKSCPFHEVATYQPANLIEAYSDQLHFDVLLLRKYSFLPAGEGRANVVQSLIGLMRMHLDQLEAMQMKEREE
jgi:hypothetical protein